MPPSSSNLGSPTTIPELSSPLRPIPAEVAADILRRVYGLDGRLTRFATEKDDTFKVDASRGESYVLKIAHPSEPRDELDLQAALLRHLEARAPHLPVPRIFGDPRGDDLPEVATGPSEVRIVRLMSFVPGLPLDSRPSSAPVRAEIGELLARLRNAMADFSHPADGRTVAWDVRHVLKLADLLPFVRQPEHRAAIERALSLFRDIEPRLSLCRRQVLHNDFNTSNLVVRAGNPDRIGGIIDFGDCVRTAVAIDVSTALMNQMPKVAMEPDRVDLFDEARDVLAGYLRHADLTDEEVFLVPFLAYARQATRALLTSWRATLFPENAAYILRNTEAGWLHLEWFSSLSPQQIGDLLAHAAH